MNSSEDFQRRKLEDPSNGPTAVLGPVPHNTLRGRLCEWIIVLIVALIYLTHLTPGHVLVSDDFAAYVMHAANLVEGRPYSSINYVPNPKALWLAPTNGYPPVYPLLLAPAYKAWGLNLRALKVVTVLCFVVFLLIFAELTRPVLSPPMNCCALLILGLNPVFWEHRDLLLSEFPYLMFSFGALLALQMVYINLSAVELRIGASLLVSVLLYLAYGTRTIGIVLLPALVLSDVIKFKRPSRFLMGVLAFTSILIIAQTILLASPKGYISAVQLSPQMAAKNVAFYAKTLSYVWQNGFSKSLQIIFALVFTVLAGVGFARKFWRHGSASEFYLLGYLAILIAWSAEIGLRGLLPVLPLYFAFGLQEFQRFSQLSGRTIRISLGILLMLLVGFIYYGAIWKEANQEAEANVNDPATLELFSFLKNNTTSSEVLIFPKPRSLALFTNRRAASLAPNELPEDSYQFMRSIHAQILVKARLSPSSWQSLIDSNKGQPLQVFSNSEYEVFRIRLDTAPPSL